VIVKLPFTEKSLYKMHVLYDFIAFYTANAEKLLSAQTKYIIRLSVHYAGMCTGPILSVNCFVSLRFTVSEKDSSIRMALKRKEMEICICP
jgi:hypothetical protein